MSPYNARRSSVEGDPGTDVLEGMLAEMRALRKDVEERRPGRNKDEVSVPRWVVGVWGGLCAAALLAAASAFQTVSVIENSYVSEARMLQEHRQIELGPPNAGAVVRFQAIEGRLQRLESLHDGREP